MPPFDPVANSTGVSIPTKSLEFLLRTLRHAHFRNDVQVLDRIYYRNKNAQRPMTYWKRLQKLRRLLVRLNNVGIEQEIELLFCACWNETSARQCKGPPKYRPDARHVAAVLHKCIAAVLLLEELQMVTEDVYLRFGSLLSQTYHMTVALICMSAVGRLHVIAKALQQEISACFAVFRTYLAQLLLVIDNPVEGKDAMIENLPLSIEDARKSMGLAAAQAVFNIQPSKIFHVEPKQMDDLGRVTRLISEKHNPVPAATSMSSGETNAATGHNLVLIAEPGGGDEEDLGEALTEHSNELKMLHPQIPGIRQDHPAPFKDQITPSTSTPPTVPSTPTKRKSDMSLPSKSKHPDNFTPVNTNQPPNKLKKKKKKNLKKTMDDIDRIFNA